MMVIKKILFYLVLSFPWLAKPLLVAEAGLDS